MQGIVSSPARGFSSSKQFGTCFESYSRSRYGTGELLLRRFHLYDISDSNVRVRTGSYGPVQLSQRALRRRVQRLEGNLGRRTVQCRNNVQSLQLDFSETEQLQQCLTNIYNAMGLQDYSLNQHIVVSGKQFLMNMEGQWSLIWCMDGRFYERYEGPELNFEWAYDGTHSPWSADAAGRVSILDLDDREVCLMASWIRTGYWLTEDGKKQLSISIEPQKGGPFSKETVFALHLKNSKVMAYLVVDNGTWLPARLSIKAFGSEDKWEYRDWQLIQPAYSSKFPMAITHNPPAGGRDLYSVTSIKVEIPGEELADAEISEKYAFPDSSLVPRSTHSYPRTHIDNNLPPTVKKWRNKFSSQHEF